VISYKGYIGIAEVDFDAKVIHGRLVGLRDVVTFEGDTIAEAEQAFRDSVDDYLEWCAKRGRPAQKPFKGNLMIRVKPSIHRDLAILAETQSRSINAVAAEAFTKYIASGDSDCIKQAEGKSAKPTNERKSVDRRNGARAVPKPAGRKVR
jgi:predicted HicB family RNase H-like nuclease